MLVLLCLLLLPYVEVEATDTHPASPSVASKRNPVITILPGDLQQALRDNQPEIVLVDVRRDEEFSKASIPGSINLPLYAVKTKAFLKTKTVVLLNNGVNYASLEQEAVDLIIRHGFSQVRILTGGLGHWRDAGGELTGNSFDLEKLNLVSARDIFVDKNYDDWLVVDASLVISRDSAQFFPAVHHLPFSQDPNDFIKRLGAVIKAGKPALPYILLINEHGDYESIKRAVANVRIRNVFYLDGGLRAYRDFNTMLALARQPQKKTGACGVCP